MASHDDGIDGPEYRFWTENGRGGLQAHVLTLAEIEAEIADGAVFDVVPDPDYADHPHSLPVDEGLVFGFMRVGERVKAGGGAAPLTVIERIA